MNNITAKLKRVQWKSRKSVTLIGIIIFAIIFFRIKYYSYSTGIHIPKVKASAVWEFLADFNNMKNLNPAIKDFVIINDSGNFDLWRYTVEYTEQSSHWPYLTSNTLAYYEVRAVKKPMMSYHINSNHTSCTIFGSICLLSYSNFDIIQKGDIVVLFEHINYQCPVIFSSLCQKEIAYQRDVMAKSLIMQFN